MQVVKRKLYPNLIFTHSLGVGVEGEEGGWTVLGPNGLVRVVCYLDLGKGIILEVAQDHLIPVRHFKRFLTVVISGSF